MAKKKTGRKNQQRVKHGRDGADTDNDANVEQHEVCDEDNETDADINEAHDHLLDDGEADNISDLMEKLDNAARDRRRERRRVRSILHTPVKFDPNRPEPGEDGYVSSDVGDDIGGTRLDFDSAVDRDETWKRRQAQKEAGRLAERKANKVKTKLRSGGSVLSDTLFWMDAGNLRSGTSYKPSVDLALTQAIDLSRYGPPEGSEVEKAEFARLVATYMGQTHGGNYVELAISEAMDVRPQEDDESVLAYRGRCERHVDSVAHLMGLAGSTKREIAKCRNDYVEVWIDNLGPTYRGGDEIAEKFETSKTMNKTLSLDEVAALASAKERRARKRKQDGDNAASRNIRQRPAPGHAQVPDDTGRVIDAITSLTSEIRGSAAPANAQIADLQRAVDSLSSRIPTTPICFNCRNRGLDCDHSHLACPNGRGRGRDTGTGRGRTSNPPGPPPGPPPAALPPSLPLILPPPAGLFPPPTQAQLPAHGIRPPLLPPQIQRPAQGVPVPMLPFPQPLHPQAGGPQMTQCKRCTREGKEANHEYKACPSYPGCGSCGQKGHYAAHCNGRCPECGIQAVPGMPRLQRHTASCQRGAWRPAPRPQGPRR